MSGAVGEAMNATDTQSQVLDDLQRASLFRLLALMFTDPAKGNVKKVQEMLGRLPVPVAPSSSLGQDFWGPTKQAWQGADPQMLEAEYDRLFRREMACPPHETSYGDGRRIGGRPTELADIRGFYEAFGVAPSSAEPDLPDHLAAELEFYTILRLKVAHARFEGNAQGVEVTSAAAASFLQDHIGRWLSAFRRAVEAAATASTYLETVRLVEAVVAEECREMGVSPQLAEGPVPDDPTTNAEHMTCPMAGNCRKRAGI
jgi:putative dimethyl sulfoxide reductase chaperone